MNTYDFCQVEQTQHLWRYISSHWQHCNRPDGQRFLGSVQISQKATEEVLDVVGDNLRRLDKFTYGNLLERFEPEQNWLRILTFSLSEYAYYAKGEEKFWGGFCKRLKLSYSCSQKEEHILRKIAGEGFKLLGLVQAKGGYRYVSTLWLQSGIPKENIEHFSQLVEEFSQEYGWWEIAHASSEDISQLVLVFCEDKYPGWGTLINFLKASCPQQDEEVEPISGQLIQGIATIAVELERQGKLPDELINDRQREKLLGSYYLPNNFFLRNWDSLIQVLTPQQRHHRSNRKIISLRSKPLSLVLDVNDSLNIQLILPDQNIWRKEWKDLGGTYCQIRETAWEGTIPHAPGLLIPQQVVNIQNTDELRQWQLLDHLNKCLIPWNIQGVTSDFACLVFDPWTGDRLNINLADWTIRGTREIICFTPKGVCLEFGHGIEILDPCVPSSVKGWRGQHLILTTEQASIKYSAQNTDISWSISWRNSIEQQPSLRGIRLKGKKIIYIEIPTLWYPPVEEEILLNISIENITCQQAIITITKKIAPSSSWQEISLKEWINQPAKYEVRCWNQINRYPPYKFEVQSDYQIIDKPEINKLIITCRSQSNEEDFPIFHDSLDKFWSEEITIEGLFPLEVISLSFRDKQETTHSQCQADVWGKLYISLASFYGSLATNSNWYILDYQRLGCEPTCLIKMGVSPPIIKHIWDEQGVKISGLLTHEFYSLSCWNLLLPEKSSLEIKIPLIESNQETINVPLKLIPGIYYIQLFSSQGILHDLGWWCVSNQHDLPDEVLKNYVLENYCYTILDNEPVKNFINAAQHFDYKYQFLEAAIDTLQKSNCQFPNWLDQNSLIQKLQALIQTLKIDIKKSNIQQEKNAVKNNHGDLITDKNRWILIQLTNPQKRKLVDILIKEIIKNRFPNEQILIQLPNQYIYKDSILLQSRNTELIKTHIKALDYVRDVFDIPPDQLKNLII